MIDNWRVLTDNLPAMPQPRSPAPNPPTSDSPGATLDYRGALPVEGRGSTAFARAISAILGPLIGLVVVIAIFGIWRPRGFLTTGNLKTVLNSNYHFAVAAVGMTFVIVT